MDCSFEHYHIMTKRELPARDNQLLLRGSIHEDLESAAFEFNARTGNRQTISTIIGNAIQAWERREILRDRKGKGRPYIYFTICYSVECDLTHMHRAYPPVPTPRTEPPLWCSGPIPILPIIVVSPDRTVSHQWPDFF
jgi:hypothetical protein